MAQEVKDLPASPEDPRNTGSVTCFNKANCICRFSKFLAMWNNFSSILKASRS